MEAQRYGKSSRPRRFLVEEQPRIPLDITGVIRASLENEAIIVTANRDTLTVDVSRLSIALKVLKGAGRRASRIKAIWCGDSFLRHSAQCLHIRIANRTVALLGEGVHPGLFSRGVARLLGLGPMDIRPSLVKVPI